MGEAVRGAKAEAAVEVMAEIVAVSSDIKFTRRKKMFSTEFTTDLFNCARHFSHPVLAKFVVTFESINTSVVIIASFVVNVNALTKQGTEQGLFATTVHRRLPLSNLCLATRAKVTFSCISISPVTRQCHC